MPGPRRGDERDLRCARERILAALRERVASRLVFLRAQLAIPTVLEVRVDGERVAAAAHAIVSSAGECFVMKPATCPALFTAQAVKDSVPGGRPRSVTSYTIRGCGGAAPTNAMTATAATSSVATILRSLGTRAPS
jgi:hypothetical protein